MTPAYEVRLRARRVALGAAAVATLAAGVGCGNDPFAVRWAADPDTVLLYSLARPDLNLPAGFDFHTRTRWRVETPLATGRWDAALDTQDGQLVLLPPGALGVVSRAGIARLEATALADVTEAPTDTSKYSTINPVLLSVGTVYAIRTHQVPGIFGTRCVYYAKMEPLVIDVASGTLEFVFDESPACNDPSLVPPD